MIVKQANKGYKLWLDFFHKQVDAMKAKRKDMSKKDVKFQGTEKEQVIPAPSESLKPLDEAKEKEDQSS